MQHLAEIQETRRKVVHTFLGYHAKFERDMEKWKTILEEDFWLKQPVTPYRSFRRCEIQKASLCFVWSGVLVGYDCLESLFVRDRNPLTTFLLVSPHFLCLFHAGKSHTERHTSHDRRCR